MDPLIIHDHYEIDYRHSYAQDSPFFVGLSKGKLLGSRCSGCGYSYATPRSHCMECGASTVWQELPLVGRVHTFTTCYYGGEAFLKETPFTLILVELDGANTLFLSRLKGIHTPTHPSPLEGEGEGGGAVRIGMPVVACFAKTPSFKVTDVWFEPRKGDSPTLVQNSFRKNLRLGVGWWDATTNRRRIRAVPTHKPEVFR